MNKNNSNCSVCMNNSALSQVSRGVEFGQTLVGNSTDQINRPFSYSTKGWVERYFYSFLHESVDGMVGVVLELLSQLGTFENSSKFISISFHCILFRKGIRSVVDLALTMAKEESNLPISSPE